MKFAVYMNMYTEQEQYYMGTAERIFVLLCKHGYKCSEVLGDRVDSLSN